MLAQGLPDISKDLREIMADCLESTQVSSKTLFPELFTSPWSSLHNSIYKVIDSPSKKKAIAAPRGLGKTTIAQATAMDAILFRKKHFIVYISNSATMAELQTENMKRELRSNDRVRELFGDIKLSDYEVDDDTFGKKSWVAFGNTLVLPRGKGQQVRGLKWLNHRPDLIILDDLEDAQEVDNPENRKKLEQWLFSDVLKTESNYGERATFIYIDTIKHEDSQLVKLTEAREWESITLSICDKHYNTLDKNYMTTAEIKQEVEDHKAKGLLSLFYRERMNIPVATELATFKEEQFKYYQNYHDGIQLIEKGNFERIPEHEIINVTLVDPAKTVELHSAESAVGTIGFHRESQKLLVREIFSEKVRPDGLYDAIFDQIERYDSAVLGVEVTSLHEFISQPLRNEMEVRDVRLIYEELKAVGSKAERIAALAPYYIQGYVYHLEGACGALEAQLLSFPKSRLWDVMDMFAYMIKLMVQMDYYFSSEDSSEGAEDEEVYHRLTEHDEPIEYRRVI